MFRCFAGNSFVENRAANFPAQQSGIIISATRAKAAGETVAERDPIAERAGREIGVSGFLKTAENKNANADE
jgi:hypothetical protein